MVLQIPTDSQLSLDELDISGEMICMLCMILAHAAGREPYALHDLNNRRHTFPALDLCHTYPGQPPETVG